MPVPKFIPKPQGFDVELQLYTKVLKLESLHWGIWEGIDELTVENLKKAQKTYTQKLLDLVPKDVKTVLDVGAGIGDNAVAFAKKGYKVLALTPEPSQIERFKELSKKHKNISFVKSKYEEYHTNQKFDLILMSESSNYFPLDEGMKQNDKLLRDGGYLLVAGLFRKKDGSVFPTWNTVNDFETSAKKIGLKLLKKEDISDPASPSMQLAYNYFENYGQPTIDVISEYYRKAFGFKAYVISLFFRKELKTLNHILKDILPNYLSVERFKKHGRYLIYLYKK